MAVTVSAGGRAKISQREGEVLHAYVDSVGVWTIGVGHTGRMSPPGVESGMVITSAESDVYLAADLAPVEAAIAKYVKVPITQNETDGIASWLFNVGVGDLRTSTILRRLNLGDIQGAANGFDLYHKPPEIIGRRNSEKAQFLARDADHPAVAAARADTLTTMASKAKTTAATTKVTGAATAAAGVAGASAAFATSHPATTGVIAVLAALASIGQGLWSRWNASRATTLVANAANQHAA